MSGRSSSFVCEFFPPIELSPSTKWELGLIDLMTFNSIPNIEANINDRFYCDGSEPIILPEGTYEIEDIQEFISKVLKDKKSKTKVIIKANNNTLKTEIYCNEVINFKENSIAQLLGFNYGDVLTAGRWHESPNQAAIVKVDVIRVQCDIVRNSYRDGVESHILHEFYPMVEPGFKIVEKPSNVIYLPIYSQGLLYRINIRLEDQYGNLVNFRNENIIIRLNLRSVK